MRLTLITISSAFILLSACSAGNKIETTSGYDKMTVIQTARKQVGVRYRYGGNSPATGFDCSGLVYYSHHKAGISLPRSASALYRMTEPVGKSKLTAGDLVFFRIARKISHVGIYIGNNQFVHAPSSGKSVMLSSLDNPYWRKHFLQGGRLD